jgi:polyferredoxin
MAKKSGIQITRIIVLVTFLLIITFAATMHQIIGGGPKGAPSIDSLCPFGGVETIYKYVSEANGFLKRTNISNFILLGGTIALAIVVGRFFCGWICMLGFLQELFGKIGLKLFKKRLIIPVKFDKYLRFLKYILLFVIIFLTWKTGELIIRPYDPFAAYAHIPAGLSIFQDMLWGLVILAVSLIASMFVDRFFCKYLCPMGALLGIVNKISIFKIKRDESTCIHCSKCTKICPVNIDVEKIAEVKSSECINCFECVTVCPTKKNTLSANMFGKFMNLVVVVIIGIGIYAGIVGISMAAGIWKTQESSTKEIVQEGSALNPDNIRGFMTIEEIAETFKININDLYKKLDISRDKIPETTQMKKIKDLASPLGKTIGEEDVRNAVRELLGMPRKDGTENKSSVEPKSEEISKIEVIKEDSKIKEQSKSVPKTEVKTDLPSPDDIKGATTLKEISETYKINLDDLYKKLNITKDKVPEISNGKEIKAILSKAGRSFEVQEIRDAVKELIK